MVFVQPLLLYPPELKREFALRKMSPANLALFLCETSQISLTPPAAFRELASPLARHEQYVAYLRLVRVGAKWFCAHGVHSVASSLY